MSQLKEILALVVFWALGMIVGVLLERASRAPAGPRHNFNREDVEVVREAAEDVKGMASEHSGSREDDAKGDADMARVLIVAEKIAALLPP